ncbi:hypothetical protein [Paraburkholderia sp. JPY419]|uniref:hypothetical protein n=1 Tax=Paraburkholderia sp. JPY419 TaxID=667660 RepID=UPI003D211D7E
MSAAALPDLLVCLRTGVLPEPDDTNRMTDALAVRLDADRHAVGDLGLVLSDPGNSFTPASRARLETLQAALAGPAHEPVHKPDTALPSHDQHEADEDDEMVYRERMWGYLEALRDYLTQRAASDDTQAAECETRFDALTTDFLIKDSAMSFVASELEPFERGEREWLCPDVDWLSLSARLHKALVGREL